MCDNQPTSGESQSNEGWVSPKNRFICRLKFNPFTSTVVISKLEWKIVGYLLRRSFQFETIVNWKPPPGETTQCVLGVSWGVGNLISCADNSWILVRQSKGEKSFSTLGVKLGTGPKQSSKGACDSEEAVLWKRGERLSISSVEWNIA